MNQIKDYVEYKDGGLYWTRQVHKSRKTKGERVGTVDKKGYRVLTFKGKKYFEHRIIFWLFNGYLPEEVDHIDRDTFNNSIENLRAANRSINTLNTRSKNVYPCSNKGGKWRAEVADNYLGVFACLGKALKAVKEKKELLING